MNKREERRDRGKIGIRFGIRKKLEGLEKGRIRDKVKNLR